MSRTMTLCLAAALAAPSLALAQPCGWFVLPQAATAGGPRSLSGFVYEGPAGGVLMFGGGLFPPFQGGTWRWDGNAWFPVATATAPAGRTAHAMAARSSGPGVDVLMYGGGDGSQNLPETWTYDGNDWTLRLVGGGPPALVQAAMVYHDAIGEFVHFGSTCAVGCFGETYTWDGTAWSALFAPTAPPARYLHAMAYDPIRQETVLYGGNLLPQVLGVTGDTWVFDGATWTQRIAPGPPPLVSHAMAFDPSRGTVVMHGGLANGSTSSTQTWEWNGLQWSLVGEANTFGHYYHRMIYDGNNSQLILIDTAANPTMREMIWTSGPDVLPVVGNASGEYPCPFTLGIQATGAGPLNYQWFKDGSPLVNGSAISGANSPTIMINPTNAATAGAYFCRVTDACGTTNSGTILVDMRCLADVNLNNVADPGDFNAWILAFNQSDLRADQNCDGLLTPADFNAWVINYNAGC